MELPFGEPIAEQPARCKYGNIQDWEKHTQAMQNRLAVAEQVVVEGEQEGKQEPTKKRHRNRPYNWSAMFMGISAVASLGTAVVYGLLLWLGAGQLQALQQQTKATATAANAAKTSADAAKLSSDRETEMFRPKLFAESQLIIAPRDGLRGEPCILELNAHNPIDMLMTTSPGTTTKPMDIASFSKGPLWIERVRIVNDGGEPVANVGFKLSVTYVDAIREKNGSVRSGKNSFVKTSPIVIPTRIYPGKENAFVFYIVNLDAKHWADIWSFPDSASVTTFGATEITTPLGQQRSNPMFLQPLTPALSPKPNEAPRTHRDTARHSGQVLHSGPDRNL